MEPAPLKGRRPKACSQREACRGGRKKNKGWPDLRAVLFGGNANNGTFGGFVASDSNYAPSLTYAHVGSRLCYFDAWKDVVYEEHEWLCGRNGAYIDTNYYPIVGTDVFSVHFHYDGTIRNPDGVEQCIFGCQNGPYNGPYDSTAIRAYINSVNYLSVAYCSTRGAYFPSTNVNSNNWELTDLKLDGNNYLFIANGVTYTFSNNDVQIETMSNSIWVFKNLQMYNSNCYFHGDIAYFKITDTSSNTKMHLIPCRLLRPIPAILDGNGIARQAGECGMWDKVSNMFYGNVANSGTFTVKGPKCYEEYKWLNCYTADGATLPAQGADISVNPIYLNSKVMTVEVGKICRNISVYGVSPYVIHMWVSGWSDNQSYVTIQERYGNDNTLSDIHALWSTSNIITLDFQNGIATVGSESFTIEGNGYYFNGLRSAMWQNPRTVGRIKISDELDLVPCKLTHGIPASMDANGIARPAGTCGMWDKVNDKFYGNVANSGTFTVSND